MSDLEDKDWRELSEAASREQDPQRLMELIKALNKALERHEHQHKERDQAATINGSLRLREASQDELAA